jgi:hypothetical protein
MGNISCVAGSASFSAASEEEAQQRPCGVAGASGSASWRHSVLFGMQNRAFGRYLGIRLRSPLPGLSLHRGRSAAAAVCAQRARPQLHGPPPSRHAAGVFCALGKMGRAPLALVETLVHAVLRRVHAYGNRPLAHVLWSLTRLSASSLPKGEPALAALAMQLEVSSACCASCCGLGTLSAAPVPCAERLPRHWNKANAPPFRWRSLATRGAGGSVRPSVAGDACGPRRPLWPAQAGELRAPVPLIDARVAGDSQTLLNPSRRSTRELLV